MRSENEVCLRKFHMLTSDGRFEPPVPDHRTGSIPIFRRGKEETQQSGNFKLKASGGGENHGN